MRVHLVCMIYMYSYLLIYDFFEVSRTQFAIIFIANAIVVMAEQAVEYRRLADIRAADYCDESGSCLSHNFSSYR